MATCTRKKAFTGWCAYRHSTQLTAGIPPLPWWKCCRRWRTTHEIEINPNDLRIDTYRSAGAGGQNVQKNDTAVRITHLPSGIVVTCQNERSQMQNRENAMRVLRARLLEIKQEEQEKQLAELRGEYTKAEWGSQIRSYVLHPYQMVKDHRTDFEVGNAQAVLERRPGRLDRGLFTSHDGQWHGSIEWKIKRRCTPFYFFACF